MSLVKDELAKRGRSTLIDYDVADRPDIALLTRMKFGMYISIDKDIVVVNERLSRLAESVNPSAN